MPSKKRKAGWQNEYIRRKYDRLNILVPQGHRQTIEEAAKDLNESINQYTNTALLQRLGLDEWPEIPDSKREDINSDNT